MPRKAPYGSWTSPITAEMIATGSVSLGQIQLDGDDVYWTEGRSAEGGRNVVVRRFRDGRLEDAIPPLFNVRSRAHEYGGGGYAVDEGAVYFANFADQRLYVVERGTAPRPLTPEGPWRYADLVVDRRRALLFCVYEDHTAESEGSPDASGVVNGIACVPLAGGTPRMLFASTDFASNPRLSPDGRRLAWLAWSHPNMPWDGTQLLVAEIAADSSLGPTTIVAGDPIGGESIFQPEWLADGSLVFVSDRAGGWWNPWRWTEGTARQIVHMEAEFATPQWVFGMSTYAPAGNRIVWAFCEQSIWRLATTDVDGGGMRRFDLPYSSISGVRTAGSTAYLVASSPTEASAVISLDVDSGATAIVKRSSETAIDPSYISEPRAIDFPSEGRTAHAFFYAPRNVDFAGPTAELPPLLVMSHGGPTAATVPALRPSIQYWTSRGVAVLDVNYGGSTGYGRAYRALLDGSWGVVDVQDCANGARYLARQGLVDGRRMAITGGSAGGYTTLCALTFTDVFQAGASYYGVSDLEALATDTHKFESRYVDRLVAPYPSGRDRYLERSPIHHTDRLSSPMIILQGLEDRVVPPNQSEMMAAALRERGLPVAYITFAGEQHGFRQSQNIKRALEAEAYFYSRIFGFDLADHVEAVEIENFGS